MSMLGSGIYSEDYEVDGSCERCEEETTFTIHVDDYGTADSECHSCGLVVRLDGDPRRRRYFDEP